MGDENLVLLTLDLKVNNLWENSLVKNFPESVFTIKKGGPLGKNYFSGLLKIKNADYRKIKNYLKKNFPLVTIDPFYEKSQIYHFKVPDKILPNILINSKSVLSWPINFLKETKRIKLISNSKEVNKIMSLLEKMNIPILKFSKQKIEFNIQEILTERQKEILMPSLNYGYYDFPKRINLNELSHKIGVSPSTLCVHLQKIENRILNSSCYDLII